MYTVGRTEVNLMQYPPIKFPLSPELKKRKETATCTPVPVQTTVIPWRHIWIRFSFSFFHLQTNSRQQCNNFISFRNWRSYLALPKKNYNLPHTHNQKKSKNYTLIPNRWPVVFLFITFLWIEVFGAFTYLSWRILFNNPTNTISLQEKGI